MKTLQELIKEEAEKKLVKDIDEYIKKITKHKDLYRHPTTSRIVQNIKKEFLPKYEELLSVEYFKKLQDEQRND